MCFSLREAPKQLKRASEATFSLINVKNVRNRKVLYDLFSYKTNILSEIYQNFMAQMIDSAEVVILAIFTFWHVFTNKVSLKQGLKFSSYQKNSQGTIKWTHLLYKK